MLLPNADCVWHSCIPAMLHPEHDVTCSLKTSDCACPVRQAVIAQQAEEARRQKAARRAAADIQRRTQVRASTALQAFTGGPAMMGAIAPAKHILDAIQLGCSIDNIDTLTSVVPCQQIGKLWKRAR